MYRQNIYVVYQAFAETVRAIDPDAKARAMRGKSSQ